MKGALETLTDYLYLIIAIAVGAIMISFIAQYSGIFSAAEDTSVFGNKAKVSERIAEEIQKCWDLHRGGLDSSSDICIELKVSCTQNFSEKSVTDYLDCKRIPNNNCTPGNCTSCTIKSYDDKEKVEWYVSSREALLEISYSGSKRRIIVREITPEHKVPPSNASGKGLKLWTLIIYPKEGYSFKFPASIDFRSNFGGGVPPYTLYWKSNVTGVLGNEGNISVSNLSVGKHNLSMQINDSQGNTLTKSVEIEILEANSTACPNSKDVAEGGACQCSGQCQKSLDCNEGHCCPAGASWSSSENKCSKDIGVLIVALRGNMKKVYSESQISQLENKISSYRSALSEDGLGSAYIYLDDANTSNIVPGGKIVTDISDWKEIDSVLDLLIPKLNSKYLLIVGGYKSFPQPEFSTGTCPDPTYLVFQTDDPYADFDPKDEVPDIPVGRVPDPNNGDMNVLLTAFDTFISLHNSGGLDLSDYISVGMPKMAPEKRCLCTIITNCFNRMALDISSSDSRVNTDDVSYSKLSGHKFLLLFVHGGYKTPQTFVHDSCGGNFMMTSQEVPSLDVKKSAWLLAACYSSYLKNKDTTSSSVPMQFLLNGGAVYFGGTLTQFTATPLSSEYCNSCNSNGDYGVGAIYQNTAVNFKTGTRVGDAYLTGKKFFLTQVPDVQTGCRYRQGHENLLYGDPTLKIKAMPSPSN